MFERPLLPLRVSRLSEAQLHQNGHSVCVHGAHCPAARTYSAILTAAASLLVAPVQTVVVSIALPQGPDAPLVTALELVVSARPRF